MEFKEALEKLLTDEGFIRWKTENPDAYLCHGFIIMGTGVWQIGYYHPEKDRITAFNMEEKIARLPEEQVFKDGGTVKKLEAEKVDVTLGKAEGIAAWLIAEKYGGENVIKRIFIIQNLKEFGSVWNITLVLSSLRTLNVKINAVDGEILSDKVTTLFEFGKKP